jgi:hypothetical protein
MIQLSFRQRASVMADAGGCADLRNDFTNDVVDGLYGAILKTEKKCMAQL